MLVLHDLSFEIPANSYIRSRERRQKLIAILTTRKDDQEAG